MEVSIQAMDQIVREYEERVGLVERVLSRHPIEDSSLASVPGGYRAVFSPDFGSFESDESLAIFKGCQELKLRLAAGLMLDAARIGADFNEDELLTSLSKPLPVMITQVGGLSYVRSGGVIFIEVPKSSQDYSSTLFDDALFEIFGQSQIGARWVLDFSGVKNVPDRHWLSLLGYYDTLKRRSGRMDLLWVDEASVRPSMFPRLRSLFNLEKFAGRWFTRPFVE